MVTNVESNWERKRRTFERTADAYDRYRQDYPDALFDDIRSYADLAAHDDRILEIGCGTGRATLHLASWPHNITALEPAEAMADVARLNLASFDNVDVLTTSFEAWPLEENTFGLVLVAQAYHWLDPATRIDRIADALYAHGSVAIMGNVQVTPPDNLPFFERVQDAYLEHAPQLAHDGPFRRPGEVPPHPFEGSERFVDLEQRTHAWSWTLPTEEYIGLLGTHSGDAALEPRTQEQLHEAIARLIDDEFGGEVTEHHMAVAGLARRAT